MDVDKIWIGGRFVDGNYFREINLIAMKKNHIFKGHVGHLAIL